MLLSLVPSWRLIFSSFPLGITYLLTVGWVLWPVRSSAAVILWIVVPLALTALSALVIVRSIRAETQGWHRQPTNRSASPRAPNTAP